jgi:hypothetical protein
MRGKNGSKGVVAGVAAPFEFPPHTNCFALQERRAVRQVLFVALSALLCVSCDRDDTPGATTRGGGAARSTPHYEVEWLRQHLDAFELRVTYYRQRGIPDVDVTFSVTAPRDEGHGRTLRTQIGRNEADTITTRLADDRFFRRNAGSTHMLSQAPEPPYYTIHFSFGPNETYVEQLGAAEATPLLDRLLGVLSGEKAQKASRRLMGRSP